MKFKDVKAKETRTLWVVRWDPEDWKDRLAKDGEACTTYVVAATKDDALAAIGISPEAVEIMGVAGFGGGVILAQ